ncbi:unnamed protein product [Trichobilharzia regenti]|nr:unnamed protein product [Trichobilharzia regenti]
MHPGAHRSVTFSFNALNKKHNHLSSSSSVNLLTDIIIPVNPCLQCITLEALLDNPAGSQSSKKTLTKLIAVSTDIACSTLVLRDIHPPIEFTRLRISIVGRLDYPHGKARIHLGAYFGRAGLLMDCFNPIQFNADNRALNIFKCLDSLIMSRTTEFITVQQKLLNIWNQSDKKPIVTRNKDESEV